MSDLSKVNPSFATAVLKGNVPTGTTPKEEQLIITAVAALRSLGNTANDTICATTNQNIMQSRYDAELQDTYVFSPKLRAVSGMGFRYDYVDSETYFGQPVSNTSFRVFSNVEHKPLSNIIINAGGFIERDHLSGTSFSPRMALNTYLSDESTLRFVISRGVRKPDLLEQRANWIYPAYNFSSPVQGALNGHYYLAAVSPKNLVGETILSKEIGYNGNFTQFGLNVDVKIFEDRLSRLISQKLQNADFNPTNGNSATLRGTELEVSYNPIEKITSHLTYSFLTNHATNIFEQSQYAKHSGSLAISYLSDNNWRTSFAYYGYGGDTNGQTFYGREDLVFQKDFYVGKNQYITPSFTISHLDNRLSSYLRDMGQPRTSLYNDSMQYWVSLTYTF